MCFYQSIDMSYFRCSSGEKACMMGTYVITEVNKQCLIDTSTTHTKCTKRATIKQQRICSYDAVMKESMLYKV